MADTLQVRLLHTIVVRVKLDLLVHVPCGARVAQISTYDLVTGHHNISALT